MPPSKTPEENSSPDERIGPIPLPSSGWDSERLEEEVHDLERGILEQEIQTRLLRQKYERAVLDRNGGNLPPAPSTPFERDLFSMRMASTLGWRRSLLAAIWSLIHQGPVVFAKKVLRHLRQPSESHIAHDGYHGWFEEKYSRAFDGEEARGRLDDLAVRPRLSIVLPVYRPDRTWLERAVESVRLQVYPHWQLCIVDDGTGDDDLSKYLQKLKKADERVKVATLGENQGIAAASNAAAGLAEGEFLGFLDQDDTLPPWCLLDVAEVLAKNPKTDLVYTDEDKVDTRGEHAAPYFKPDWSPDLFLSHNYLCHFVLLRKALFDALDGFRTGFEGAQDYDLLLRVTERTDRIIHVPRIDYHWRMIRGSTALRYGNKPDAERATFRALEDALERRGTKGAVSRGIFGGSFRVRRELPSQPLVSVLIPTRDGLPFLRNCLSSLRSRTSYANYEVLVADNGSEEEAMADYLAFEEKEGHLRVISCPGPFNFPALNNRLAQEAKGEVLLLLNNDTEVLSPGWMEAMLEHALRKEVGAVGAKLLYRDGTVQHAGVVLGIGGGVAGHSHKYFSKYSHGTNGHIDLIRNYSAVTGACLMMRKKVYEEVGGLDAEHLPRAFNDVDLCLKLREKGYLIVYTPYAVLYHHESASRGFVVEGFEIDAIQRKWKKTLRADPYYNPNLTLDREDFGLR